ncbi:MAG: NAD-dependent epimerase/dehydratase family protein, partial [Bradymonadaceae bacterium]
MIDPNRLRPTKNAAIRMIADAVMVNVAMIAALAGRYLYLVGFQTLPQGVGPRETLMAYTTGYASSGWLLTLLAVGIFLLSGVYTEKRTHRIRYRALNLARGTMIAFLLFGFFSYFFNGALPVSRSSLIVGWLGSFALLTGSRFWSNFWRHIVLEELRGNEEAADDDEVEDVLVIGGAGYIGSALLPELLEAGYNVRLLDLLLYGTEPIEEVLDHD